MKSTEVKETKWLPDMDHVLTTVTNQLHKSINNYEKGMINSHDEYVPKDDTYLTILKQMVPVIIEIIEKYPEETRFNSIETPEEVQQFAYVKSMELGMISVEVQMYHAGVRDKDTCSAFTKRYLELYPEKLERSETERRITREALHVAVKKEKELLKEAEELFNLGPSDDEIC